MNKRGQALVEFVLILPLFLLMIFAFIDFGRIIVCKSHLENIMSEVSNLVYQDKKMEINNLLKNDEYEIKYNISSDQYTKIVLETNIDLITPGMNLILSDPYVVKIERSLINE